MEDNMNAIEVKNVSKRFRLPHETRHTVKSVFIGILKGNNSGAEIQQALSGISFEVKKGEFYGIVGRNGSGKSTLLKILAGIYQPTAGGVAVQGKLVPFIELGVGFNPELTGRENVYLNGAMLGFSKKEIDRFYPSIVKFAELERFMDQKLKNYSSGMQVRLAFSLAIRANADILLVDEVLAVGDTDFQRKCFDYFRELKRSKTTVIFVSHDMGAVREYCDKALLIDKSKVVKVGSPEEVAKLYTALFTEQGKSEDSGQKSVHLGNQSVVVQSVKPNYTSYKAEEENVVELVMKIQAKEDTEANVSAGFVIKNATNTSVLGINTYELNKPIGSMKQGEIRTLTWKVPNVFGDGKYIIDAAVTSTDGTIVYDWREDVAWFRSYRREYSPYIVTPTIEVEIKKG